MINITEILYLNYRMFVDSLDALHANSGNRSICLLGSSELEVCYLDHVFWSHMEFNIRTYIFYNINRKSIVTVGY